MQYNLQPTPPKRTCLSLLLQMLYDHIVASSIPATLNFVILVICHCFWLKLVCEAYWNKKINRCWSWDLYAYQTGKWNLNSPPVRKTVKRTQYLCETNWTNIDDETDDFDKPHEIQRWKDYWKKND